MALKKILALLSRVSKPRQYVFSLLLVISVALVCFFSTGLIGYRVVALLLLFSVSSLAIFFDIMPVLVASLLSAFIWNFFFLPPVFAIYIGSTEDALFLLMYVVIAVLNAVLTHKIKQAEKEARIKENRIKTLQLYDTLLNSLSHELRTPIAAIVSATDTLQSSSLQLSNEDRGLLLGEISQASVRLNQQVENLLNMSRLESGFLQPQKDWCDINEVVYKVVERIEENKATQTIQVEISPELPLFKLDKGMLEQILYNLLHNACLYTPWNSEVRISAQNRADGLELIVEDNGKGFPKEEVERVFDKFYRLKNTQTGGTGLGLSIVKGFTEAFGGTVRLGDATPNGARFTINIPAATTQVNKNDEQWLRPKY